MLVGYACVSTQHQTPALQLDALSKTGCGKVFSEKGPVAKHLLHGSNYYYYESRRYLVMPNVEKVSIALTPEMLAVVREAVESGEYASTSEVMREALRAWKRRRALEEKDIEELRRLWTEGLESGPGRFADMAAIKAEARQRLEGTQRTEE